MAVKIPVSFQEIAALKTLVLAQRSDGKPAYHGSSRTLFAVLPDDLTHPVSSFVVEVGADVSYRDASVFYRFDSFDDAVEVYAEPLSIRAGETEGMPTP